MNWPKIFCSRIVLLIAALSATSAGVGMAVNQQWLPAFIAIFGGILMTGAVLDDIKNVCYPEYRIHKMTRPQLRRRSRGYIYPFPVSTNRDDNVHEVSERTMVMDSRSGTVKYRSIPTPSDLSERVDISSQMTSERGLTPLHIYSPSPTRRLLDSRSTTSEPQVMVHYLPTKEECTISASSPDDLAVDTPLSETAASDM